MTVAATVVLALATLVSGARWLRVAQREHYLAGSVSRFALRWWRTGPLNPIVLLLGVAGLACSTEWPLAGVATAAVVVAAPFGLGLRGRTSTLGRTRRLETLAGAWVVLQAMVVGLGIGLGVPVPLAAAGALLAPLILDAACGLTTPLERALAERFVTRAAARLAAVKPTIVGITGSYGKTSTKHHVVHLVGTTRALVASPASFNNRAGLARAVNEHVGEGTEVFVAEMGTYGPGEIAELCRWCPPAISAITAIGPVHLERFGSEDRIVTAKSEILVPASTVVLNVGDPRLAAVADRVAGDGRRVFRARAAADPADGGGAGGPGSPSLPDQGPADVTVEMEDGRARLVVEGRELVSGVALAPGVHPGNVACAVAIALALGVAAEDVAARVASIPGVANRLQAAVAPSGVTVLDDTFNSNPSGARAALRALATVGEPAGAAAGVGRRVVVTPGMVELGRRQGEENRSFAAEVARAADVLVVVGATNRRALVAGWRSVREEPPVLVPTRPEAVAWVRRELGPGDAVLYENDLPDHYP